MRCPLALVALSVALASGCRTTVVVKDPPPPHREHVVVVREEDPGDLECHEAPPVVREEVRPARPSRVHVWIGGHWARRGSSWVWVPGHWHEPPHGYTVWRGGCWERRGSVHVWVGGRWG